MQKIFKGTIFSLKMDKTAVVEVIRYSPHPLYRKLIKSSKKYKAATGNQSLKVGDIVSIAETKPTAKDKRFKIVEAVK